MQSTFVFALESRVAAGQQCWISNDSHKKGEPNRAASRILRTCVLSNVFVKVLQVLAYSHHKLVSVSAINNAVIVTH